jgi:hypothetical protein
LADALDANLVARTELPWAACWVCLSAEHSAAVKVEQ